MLGAAQMDPLHIRKSQVQVMGKPLLLGLLAIYPCREFSLAYRGRTPVQKAVPQGAGKLSPLPISGQMGGRHCPCCPQIPPVPAGEEALGGCQSITSLLAALGPCEKVSVCSSLESLPHFWVSILLFDRF